MIFSIVCGKTKGLFVMSFPTYPQKENVFSLYTSFINPGWTEMSIGSLNCHSSPLHNPWRARESETRPRGSGGGDIDTFPGNASLLAANKKK